MSYLAGCPAPSLTSVNDRVADESVMLGTPRSDTVPGRAAAAVTVSALVPLCPSLVAVMVTEPAARPFTRPLALTVATPALLLAHVTVRPLNVFPLASL